MFKKMSALVRRITSVIGSAAILLFFSEFYFLNEGPVQTLIGILSENPAQIVVAGGEFILFYSLFAYIFLIVLESFQVKTIWALFLAGAIFGWATEALLVPVVYESVPFSFLFPSISWHALIDVMFGWYLIRRIMRLNRLFLSTGMFILTGLAWGAWATWFLVETDPAPLAAILPGDFAVYAITTSVIWITGMIILDYSGSNNLSISTLEIVIVLLIASVFFVITALPFLPYSLAIIPLIAITLFALWRGRAVDTGDNILHELDDARPGWWQYFLALLTPLMAMVIYPFFYHWQWVIPSEDILILLLIAGFFMFLFALFKLLRSRA